MNTIYFCIAGFENGLPIILPTTLNEIQDNIQHAETYYALQEALSGNDGLMEFLLQNPNKAMAIHLTRDAKEISGAHIMRISQKEYYQLKKIFN